VRAHAFVCARAFDMKRAHAPRSALRRPNGHRPTKRVRFAPEGALAVVLGPAGASSAAPAAPAPAAPASGFQFAQLTTVSRTAVTPLFNIPATARRRPDAKLWGEAWPSPAAPDPAAAGADGDDDDWETVLEWFCDECDGAIADDATRYECAECAADYCRCVACYRKGVISGAGRHAHPLVPSTAPFHISNPAGARTTVPAA